MHKKLLAASVIAAALSTQAMAASGPISLYLYANGVDKTNSSVSWTAGVPMGLSYVGYNADSCDVAFYRTPYGTSNRELLNYAEKLPASFVINNSYDAGYTYQFVVTCFNETSYKQASLYLSVY